jgi:adenylate cyclase
MTFQNQIIGMIAIGRKKSGRFYNSEDIDLLKTLANQGSVAIENAKLAEKMRTEEVVRANLSRYLSPQVVDRVMSRKMDVDLGGDRKDVTVLISDIRDFTTLAENHPPDRLALILNEYFTEMAGVIFRHRGSLDKYVGDSIVAVFGSLIEVRNPTQSAVQAAVEMMKHIGKLNGKWSLDYGGFRMEIGVGIDRGEVFLGNVGSPERMEFTVLGRAVNTASLLSEESGPGQILITDGAAKALDRSVSLREAEPVKGKKKSGKIKVFEVFYTVEGVEIDPEDQSVPYL